MCQCVVKIIRLYSVLNSPENLTKAVKRLPYPLRNSFYKDSKNVTSENQISLLQFETWLGNKLKEFFNPVASIIANQEPDTRRSNKLNFESKISGVKIKCWFCSNSHKSQNVKNS